MRLFRTSAAAVGSAALIMLGSTAAFAVNYNVTAGGVNDGSDVAVSASAANIDFETPLVSLGCSSAASSGDTDIHTGSVVDVIGTIHDTDWSGCVGWLGLPLTFEHIGDWNIEGTSGATSGNSDVITSEVTNVTIYVSQTGAPGNCAFTLEGSMSATLDEATQTLAVNETGFTGDLTITDMHGTGCYTLFQLGDPANLVGDFVLSGASVYIS